MWQWNFNWTCIFLLFFFALKKLTLQFMYDEFVEDYEPTKADSYRKKVSCVTVFFRNVMFKQLNITKIFFFLGCFGWWGSANRHSRYSRTGGLCRHSRQLFSKWWRIFVCIFHNRRWKLPSNSGIPVSFD